MNKSYPNITSSLKQNTLNKSVYSFYRYIYFLIAAFFSFVSQLEGHLEAEEANVSESGNGYEISNSDPTHDVVKSMREVTVETTPLKDSPFDAAQSVTVLDQRKLQTSAGDNLGSVLATQPGITASSFGPGAARPVIRGVGGDRIKVLENGIDTLDVSNTSPDHAVAVDPFNVSKIEVVRGPATLLYGPNTVGGLVNVFDYRIPDELPTKFSSKIQAQGNTVDNGRVGGASFTAPFGNFALHVDAFKRRTDDIEIPGFARTKTLRETAEPFEFGEPKGTLPFSDTDTENAVIGGSYFFDSGHIGVALSNFNSLYGVPNGEENIAIDLNRQRIDVRGKFFDLNEFLSSVDFKLGGVDYDHSEFEGDEKGTKFSNDAFDSRVEFSHKPIGPLEGIFGVQVSHSGIKAIGEEAFQPPSQTKNSAVFIFEELKVDEHFKLQSGGRFDYTTLDSQGFEDRENEERLGLTDAKIRNFPTVSGSVGGVYKPSDNYVFTLTAARTERAPSSQELFANGPHIATDAFEIGNSNFDSERSVGVDLNVRKKGERLSGFLSGFYNRYSNFIGLNPRGEIRDELNVFEFRNQRAEFFGFESQILLNLMTLNSHKLDFDFQPDYVRARDVDTGQPLPRIAPLRFKFGLNYSNPLLFDSRLEVLRVQQQNRVAQFETQTNAYTTLNFIVSREFPISNYPVSLFLKGSNLTNSTIRDHVSFLKDIAPLPGRAGIAGVSITF
jgi:iron complex outermembrane recepter protein